MVDGHSIGGAPVKEGQHGQQLPTLLASTAARWSVPAVPGGFCGSKSPGVDDAAAALQRPAPQRLLRQRPVIAVPESLPEDFAVAFRVRNTFIELKEETRTPTLEDVHRTRASLSCPASHAGKFLAGLFEDSGVPDEVGIDADVPAVPALPVRPACRANEQPWEAIPSPQHWPAMQAAPPLIAPPAALTASTCCVRPSRGFAGSNSTSLSSSAAPFIPRGLQPVSLRCFRQPAIGFVGVQSISPQPLAISVLPLSGAGVLIVAPPPRQAAPPPDFEHLPCGPPPPHSPCFRTVVSTVAAPTVELAGVSARSIVEFAAPSAEPQLGTGQQALPSIGSAAHGVGNCKPCAFSYTKGCENGIACHFCHLCDRGEKKRRQKGKKEAISAKRSQLLSST